MGGKDLATEVSYKNGVRLKYGTRGSIRVDVAEGPIDNPTRVFDFKTGGAKLTPERIAEIQRHLPGGNKVPVCEIR